MIIDKNFASFLSRCFITLSFILDTCYTTGFGIGGLDKEVGNASDWDECIKLVKREEPTAYGASFQDKVECLEQNGKADGEGKCYAEFGRNNMEHSDSSWKTCIFKGNTISSKVMLSILYIIISFDLSNLLYLLFL